MLPTTQDVERCDVQRRLQESEDEKKAEQNDFDRQAELAIRDTRYLTVTSRQLYLLENKLSTKQTLPCILEKYFFASNMPAR
jgi:hypothetical protein